MALIFADTSAIVRAYIPSEPDHEGLRALLLEGDPVVASEVVRAREGGT